MNETLEKLKQELQRTQERNLFLEDSNLRYVSALDMLASCTDRRAG